MTSIKKIEVLKCIEYVKHNNLFDKLNNIYISLPSGDCSGCGNCCMESVGINLIEFLNIFNYLENKPELKVKCISKVIDYYFLEYTKKSSCPFKDHDNRCMIYEVRPLNCRLFGHWREKDYNKNLTSVTNRNIEYKELMKSKYNFDISDEVVNYKINYCKDFKPQNDYLSKANRLSFSDEVMVLDSKLLSKGDISIDFKDRGIVEYFIEYLLHEDMAYKIKIRISKNESERNIAIKRLKKILLK